MGKKNKKILNVRSLPAAYGTDENTHRRHVNDTCVSNNARVCACEPNERNLKVIINIWAGRPSSARFVCANVLRIKVARSKQIFFLLISIFFFFFYAPPLLLLLWGGAHFLRRPGGRAGGRAGTALRTKSARDTISRTRLTGRIFFPVSARVPVILQYIIYLCIRRRSRTDGTAVPKANRVLSRRRRRRACREYFLRACARFLFPLVRLRADWRRYVRP